MKFGEFPFYLLVILAVLWWRLPDNGADIRTPRLPEPPPGQAERTPTVPILPGPGGGGPRYVVDDDGPAQNSVGTAFAIDDGGYWVTARHVVRGCNSVLFVAPDNRHARTGGPVWIHPHSDMALVKGPKPRTAFRLAPRTPGKGASAFHIGYPKGVPGDVWSKVIGPARMTMRGRYRSDEPVVAYAEVKRYPAFSASLGGMSGGPIFDGAGQIIGVTVAGSPRRGRVIGTVPNSFTELFEEANRRPGSTGTSTPAISPATLKQTGDALRHDRVVAKLACVAS